MLNIHKCLGIPSLLITINDGCGVALLNNLRHSPCLEIILVILCNILNYKILLRMGITCDSIISGTRPLDIFRRLAIIGVDFKIFRIAVVFWACFLIVTRICVLEYVRTHLVHVYLDVCLSRCVYLVTHNVHMRARLDLVYLVGTRHLDLDSPRLDCNHTRCYHMSIRNRTFLD